MPPIKTPSAAPAPAPKKVPEYLPAVLIAASVAILVFFTYGQYYSLVAAKEGYNLAAEESNTLKGEQESLNALQAQSQTPALQAEIASFAAPYREDAILDSLFPTNPGVLVLSVGLKKGQKLPIGLAETEIPLVIRADNQDVLFKYLAKLTDPAAKKRYVIKSASFPFDSSPSSDATVQASVTL